MSVTLRSEGTHAPYVVPLLALPVPSEVQSLGTTSHRTGTTFPSTAEASLWPVIISASILFACPSCSMPLANIPFLESRADALERNPPAHERAALSSGRVCGTCRPSSTAARSRSFDLGPIWVADAGTTSSMRNTLGSPIEIRCMM